MEQRTWAAVIVLGAAACGACTDDSNNAGIVPPIDASADTGAKLSDGGTLADSGAPRTGNDAATDGGGCPASWTVAPVTDPSIAVPSDGGGVLLHASATGTQDYACQANAVDGGAGYVWTFTGPEATLADCNSQQIATHFASAGGAAAPEWMATDGTYVIGKKVAAFTPTGGSPAIPWLLLSAQSHSGSGVLSRAGYIQRVNTTGGTAPASACDVDHVGTTQKVPYTADYYFFGN